MKKIFKLVVAFSAITILVTPLSTHAFSNNPVNAVIQITCVSNKLDVMQGSGVIVSSDGKIITNAHVVASNPYKLWGCWGGMITKENSYKPDSFFNIKFFYSNITNDLAFGKVDSSLDGYERYLSSSDVFSSYPYLKLNFNTSIGQGVRAVGYPGIAEGNLNITKGSITSKPIVGDYKYLFSDVSVSYGNSGGAVVNDNNELLGLATAVNSSDVANNTYILDVNSLYIEKGWLNKVKTANPGDNSYNEAMQFIDEIFNLNGSSDIQYPNNTGTKHTNYSSTLSLYDLDCKSKHGVGSRYFKSPDNDEKSGCYCINNYEWRDSSKSQCVAVAQLSSKNVNEEEKGYVKNIDKSLCKRLSGQILLQVEKNGEGWYLYPDNQKKYYLGKPKDAFEVMRNLGLGIKHDELQRYLNSKFPSRLSGKILLDIEKKGEAYYINPKNLKGYFLNRPKDAFNVMKGLGLGIANTDLRKIDVGEL